MGNKPPKNEGFVFPWYMDPMGCRPSSLPFIEFQPTGWVPQTDGNRKFRFARPMISQCLAVIPSPWVDAWDWRELPWFTFIYGLNSSQIWVNMPYMEHLEKKNMAATSLKFEWCSRNPLTPTAGCYGVLYALRLFLESTIILLCLKCAFFSDSQHIHQVLIQIFQFMISSPSTIGKWWNAAYDKSSMETSYPSSNLPLGIQMSHKKKLLLFIILVVQ